jgi:predicted RNase H-like HicB family nuclease
VQRLLTEHCKNYCAITHNLEENMVLYSLDMLKGSQGSDATKNRQIKSHYSNLIEWSEEDQAYLVTLPEWADRVMMPATHGNTYSEAAKNGQEVPELLIESATQDREPLPTPKIHAA